MSVTHCAIAVWCLFKSGPFKSSWRAACDGVMVMCCWCCYRQPDWLSWVKNWRWREKLHKTRYFQAIPPFWTKEDMTVVYYAAVLSGHVTEAEDSCWPCCWRLKWVFKKTALQTVTVTDRLLTLLCVWMLLTAIRTLAALLNRANLAAADIASCRVVVTWTIYSCMQPRNIATPLHTSFSCYTVPHQSSTDLEGLCYGSTQLHHTVTADLENVSVLSCWVERWEKSWLFT